MRFIVKDTGIGIPVDQQSQIFDAFFQVASSAARRFGGTGLGLSVTRQFVELMGGDLGFESVDDEGSIFWVELEFDNTEHKSAAAEHRGAIEKSTPVSIVAVTANAFEGDRQDCLDAGINDYISKLFTQTQFEEMLDLWLPDELACQAQAAHRAR
jgi:CheY-like chemotaxis protein